MIDRSGQLWHNGQYYFVVIDTGDPDSICWRHLILYFDVDENNYEQRVSTEFVHQNWDVLPRLQRIS